MKSFTDAELEAFHSGRQKYLRLVFSDGTIVENADIASESMSFSQTICEESQLTFGRCSSACFKVQLLGVAQRYAGLTVTATISAIDLEGVTHSRQLGVFKVISDKATSNKLGRDLECYDKLYDILPTDYSTWYNQLSFPMTLKAYRDAFFTHIGVTQETVTLVNDNMTVTKNFVAENYSGADIIQDICEINGVFGILNSDNKFQYITVEEPPKALFPSDDLYPSDDIYPIDATHYINHTLTRSDYFAGQLNYEEFTVQPITQLQVRMSENDIGAIVGTEGNTYIIQDNPLVYGKNPSELTTIANNILGNIANVTYVPMSVQIIASLWFELGDSFRIHTDRDVINTVFLSVELTGITALKQKWESAGQEYYTEKANSVERNILVVKQKTNELERNVEETKSTITEVQQDLEDNVTTLQSQITQNATSITAEVSRATNAEKLILADYSNNYVPSLTNLPASEWTNDTIKSQHVGEIFYNSDNGKYYQFVCDGLSVNFSSLCSTERNADYIRVYYYDGSVYKQSEKLSGGYNNSTNNIAGAHIFVPNSTIYIEWVADGSIIDWGFKIDSIVKTNGQPFSSTNVSSLPISVTDTISGVTNLPESAHPYTNTISKMYQINTGISVNGYQWVELGNSQSSAIRSVIKQTADEISQEVVDSERGVSSAIKQNANSISSEVTRATNAEGTLSSRISQTESDITLKVSKGDVSSQLSVESGQVTISSNRLVINSTNFQLTNTGVITADSANLTNVTITGGTLTTIGSNSWVQVVDGQIRGGPGTNVGSNRSVIKFDSEVNGYTGIVHLDCLNGIWLDPGRAIYVTYSGDSYECRLTGHVVLSNIYDTYNNMLWDVTMEVTGYDRSGDPIYSGKLSGWTVGDVTMAIDDNHCDVKHGLIVSYAS